MNEIIPYNKQDPAQWKQHNDDVVKNIHDDALKAIVNGVLNLHALEQTGDWKKAGRRLDYSDSTFEVYLQHHTTWSLKDFRLLEEAVFQHFDELQTHGMGRVLQRLKKIKKEPNPLLDRRLKRAGRRVR